MTSKEFLELKGGERFTHLAHGDRVFEVKCVARDKDHVLSVHTVCGMKFCVHQVMTLLPPGPEQAEAEQPKPILIRANEIINGDRARDYGPARENLERIAARWSQVFGVPVSINQVCMAMIDVKMARLIASPDHEDSWVDIPGYAGVMDKARRGE